MAATSSDRVGILIRLAVDPPNRDSAPWPSSRSIDTLGNIVLKAMRALFLDSPDTADTAFPSPAHIDRFAAVAFDVLADPRYEMPPRSDGTPQLGASNLRTVIDDGCAKCELTVLDSEATLATCSKAGGKMMPEPDSWRHMASAPKDGSRILVTIRPSEQGAAEVDLVYWSNGDQFGADGWRASDSSPGRIIQYAEPELKCWMPMPSANLNRTSMPSPWEGEDERELDGSGI